jgi:Undecaprenyl-phosphate galactose phosphotransferase WbaP
LAAILLRLWIGEMQYIPQYIYLLPLLLLFFIAYALRGLYPAVGLSPVEELTRLSMATTIVFMFIIAFTFWTRSAEIYSRLSFGFFWILALVIVPVGRWLLRIFANRLRIWGEPVVVIGPIEKASQISQYLLKRMRFGLRPVVIITDSDRAAQEHGDIQVLHLNDNPEGLFAVIKNSGIRTAILTDFNLPLTIQTPIQNQKLRFRRLILISELGWIGSLGVTPYDLEGLLGLEIHQNLLIPWHQSLKRLIDICLSLVLGLLMMPLMGLFALLIRINTKGRIFFPQERIGKDDKKIVIWKFRTMVANSEAILHDYLASHPAAKEEWDANQKLRHDPRVTGIGKILRRTSLDELPQLWNVLKGDMSLVGPRPFMPYQVVFYKDGLTLYNSVRPGITGLWQVSGRADSSYQERVRFDEYYVRNWSIWLDIYILLRTVWVVIQLHGAY